MCVCPEITRKNTCSEITRKNHVFNVERKTKPCIDLRFIKLPLNYYVVRSKRKLRAHAMLQDRIFVLSCTVITMRRQLDEQTSDRLRRRIRRMRAAKTGAYWSAINQNGSATSGQALVAIHMYDHVSVTGKGGSSPTTSIPRSPCRREPSAVIDRSALPRLPQTHRYGSASIPLGESDLDGLW